MSNTSARDSGAASHVLSMLRFFFCGLMSSVPLTASWLVEVNKVDEHSPWTSQVNGPEVLVPTAEQDPRQ